MQEHLSGQTHSGIARIKYMPYQMDIALSVVDRIGKGIEPSFTLSKQVEATYRQLIMFFHGDPEFKGDLTKGILLMGPSGTGKSLAMEIMKKYQTIDNIRFYFNGKVAIMSYEILDSTMLVSYFIENAFDGIEAYCRRYVLCIDEIGAESNQVKHFGNNLDVISHVLSQRYAKRLMTFGTTNYPTSMLEERYDDRIVSRMYALFNFIEMTGCDFRKKKHFESSKPK